MTTAQGDAELLGLSALGLAERLGRGEVTSLAATEACLRRIRTSDGALGAFLCVDERGALEAARASDARRAAGRPLGPLDGVPLALKDNLVTEGLVTTAGSRMLAGWVPPYDSAVAERLRAAGLPIVGKTNLDEFGMGSSTEGSAFQVTRNPWNPARTPGGSSGGSAAAVAARQVYGALGTDTGGSIRQPAALCGVVGLKPTYGRVSRLGVVAYASSLDQVGPMGRTVRDAAALLQLIAGFDARDSTSAPEPVPDYLASCGAGVRGLRVGLPREYFVAGMDAEVERAVRGAAASLERAGATVEEVSLPLTSVALPAYYVIATCEASANLARYDGVRYGHRAAGVSSLRELYERSRAEGFGPEVKRRILLGTFALSAGYHDAYAIKAQRVRTLVRRDFEAAFQRVDVLLSAPCPVPAWPLGAMLEDPLAMYLLDALTIPCNLAGLPGVSVPVGLTAAGLPLAAQLVGRPFEEPRLLAAAQALEDAAAFTAAPP